MEEKSAFLRLGFKDIAKGFLTSVISGTLTGIYQVVQNGGNVNPALIKSTGLVGLASGIGYLIKNVFTNSKDEFGKVE
tara:strand:+ start:1284 stop:1517 length:234 start_codon:yes stop_codon:yes gene_type:complete